MSLRNTQVSLADWICAPEGVKKGLAGRGRPTEPGHPGNPVERLVTSDERLDAVSRLEIYANAYFYRVLDVLREDYPALSRLLGEDLFHDLVTSYLLVEPSRHPSLRFVGSRLPQFIAEHDAGEGIRKRASWAADLAAFEWARVTVFDAPDGETLSREQVSVIAPEDFGSIALSVGPWVEERTVSHAVDELWRVDSDLKDIAGATDRIAFQFLIWRKNEKVLHRRLDPIEASALSTLTSGTTFGELCESVAIHVGEAEAPPLAAGWLETWLRDGLLRSTGATGA